jgi:hypothetical protein
MLRHAQEIEDGIILKKLLKNHKGTAEIVGTVLFLVILFFFFSNVFLWHNQVTREVDGIIADKMNSAVRIETTILSGQAVHSGYEHIAMGTPTPYYQYDPQDTSSLDGDYRTIRESGGYSLDVDYAFTTAIDSPEKKRLISAIRFGVHASFSDPSEACFVYAYDWVDAAWIDTRLMITKENGWSNTTLPFPTSYIDGGGIVKIRIVDTSSQLGINDTRLGMLSIDCMEVYADSVGLEVTNLGGSDASMSRLWIVNSTQTANPEKDHIYSDLEPLSIPPGSHREITFNMAIGETQFNQTDGSVRVTVDTQGAMINYVPPSGQTVIFRVFTKLGNTAACSIDFHD